MGVSDGESRTRLLDVPVGLVEDVCWRGGRGETGTEGYSADFQVCMPYRGLFVWHVGDDEVVGDANQVVFVRGGEGYRISGPHPEGYAELVITPDPDILSEIAGSSGIALGEHPLFKRRAALASPRLQRFRAAVQRSAAAVPGHDLGPAELLLALLRAAFQGDRPGGVQIGTRTARLVRRAKEFLEAEWSSRVTLTGIGRAVGASPAYLTDLFRRVEGVSLHQYLTRLRLARALVELPHAASLSTLGLDLGFSSHSHFSAAFRRAFGCTPSQFRHASRRGARPTRPYGRDAGSTTPNGTYGFRLPKAKRPGGDGARAPDGQPGRHQSREPAPGATARR